MTYSIQIIYEVYEIKLCTRTILLKNSRSVKDHNVLKYCKLYNCKFNQFWNIMLTWELCYIACDFVNKGSNKILLHVSDS